MGGTSELCFVLRAPFGHKSANVVVYVIHFLDILQVSDGVKKNFLDGTMSHFYGYCRLE